MADVVPAGGVARFYWARCRRCRRKWGPFKSLAVAAGQPDYCQLCR